VTIIAPELSAKRLELPEAAAQSLAVQLQVLEVRGAEEIASAFEAMKNRGAEALNVLASPLLQAQRKIIIVHAAQHRLPAIYQWRESAEDGGLIPMGRSCSTCTGAPASLRARS
jgi:putative tryptophan/tyrosine transport system substrate-binding protein